MSINSTRKIQKDKLFDYSTKKNREATISWLFEHAKNARENREEQWKLYDAYYNNIHEITTEISEFMKENGADWLPCVVTDAYIHVEGQIEPDLPTPEFKGRDSNLDSEKAKQREYVTKFILENNDVQSMVPRSERRMLKYGDSFFKVYYDKNIVGESTQINGDIVVCDVGPENIFPDPAAKCLEDCEYVDYVYRLHKRKAERQYKTELKKLGLTIDQLGVDINHQDTELFICSDNDTQDDSVQVIEHWYRDEEGDMCCSILINLIEIKHIEKYWQNTGKRNKCYPFIHMWRIGNENEIWNKSEIEVILPLIDSADRELAYGLINDAFMANDIYVVEKSALIDGEAPDMAPGSIVTVKDNKINSVRRLGGITQAQYRLNTVQKLQDEIERTIGNYDSTMGKEPARVTTASGIALLNERADARKNIKSTDRLNGYRRLFELIDWTALEFYDEDRLIFVGAKKKGDPEYSFKFNSKNMVAVTPEIFDSVTNEKISGGEAYYPRIDVTVNAGDGLKKSKAFTVSVLQQLAQVGITPENYKLIIMFIESLDIPQRDEIISDIKARFETSTVNKENTQAAEIPPELQSIIQSLDPQMQQTIMNNPQIAQMALQE